MAQQASASAFDPAILAAVEDTLADLLPDDGPDQAAGLARIAAAMRYSALGGGKRLRPCLALHAADLFGVPRERSLRAAASVEFIHCYSLIHDDLPAMDDSDLRRGRPSCHRQFDEATAILAGDALLTAAFGILAAAETHPDGAVRARMVAELAAAAGHHGMVGGQMMDILADGEEGRGAGEVPDIALLQSLKTGAMIAVACRLGALLGEAAEKDLLALDAYADRIGLAFQITDDLLDVTGSEAAAGKPVGQDAGKLTFVDRLGEAQARTKAETLVREAKEALSPFGAKAAPLAAIADFILARGH